MLTRGNRGRLRIASIIDESIVDGPGLRLVVFCQGCPHHCPGCHNPETHDPAAGYWLDLESILERYRENPLLAGITFSGGEPFAQAESLALMARAIHDLGGDVITYTGFVYEDLKARPLSDRPGVLELLAETDLLVDGPYRQSLRSLELAFRGSSNQRLLDRDARRQLDRESAAGCH